MQFADYKNFKFYCLKIAKNKNVVLDNEQISSFDRFERFYNDLNFIDEKELIKLPSDFLNKLCELFKKDAIHDCISHMDYFVRKFEKVLRKEVDFYYIITSLKTMLGIEVEFQQKAIANNNYGGNFTQDKMPIIEILEDEETIYTISNLDFNYTGKHGVYFIYDSDEKLSYIGKSVSCILTRSLSSARERELLDFSKIELRETETKSDVAIYEAYYISKYKPSCNRDIVYDDLPSITLTDLYVSKTISRNKKQDYKKFKYTYFKKTVVELNNYSAAEKAELIVYNSDNIQYLCERGMQTKYEAKNEIYSKEIAEIRNTGGLATSEIFDLIK